MSEPTTMVFMRFGRHESRQMPPIRIADKQFTAYENFEYGADGELIERYMSLSPCIIIGWHYVPESAWQ